jgi:hypothetical protein
MRCAPSIKLRISKSLQAFTNASQGILTPGNVSTGVEHCDFDAPVISVNLGNHANVRQKHSFGINPRATINSAPSSVHMML